ncbi:LOW QUALITY PROTEIN: solute carrier family 35 member E1 homolog [Choristoneura fumiferana]|uniref:LOW QUALITY PROTEIN: solute carrier family 35 member E1 homolog n=1 Tax=Choristoneura fumiferana TaxID=7141 RepID=UPI003D15D334
MRGWARSGALAALCALWFGCSALGNVVGKLLLQEFPWPGTLALAQLVGAALLCSLLLSLSRERRRPRAPRRRCARCAAALAGAKFLTALCSQLSLWTVPVSYAHTVKATTPLWTAGLAWALFGERQAAGVAPALVLVALGVALASATELQFHWGGLAAALAAAALLALQHLYSSRLLAGAGWSPLRALRALSALAAALFLPVWAWRDGAALARDGVPARAAALLALDALLAAAAAAAAFSVLARVTPLSYAVLSCGKRVLVVGGSLLALRNPAPPLNVAGMALAAGAVLLYQRAKLRAPAAQPLLPV